MWQNFCEYVEQNQGVQCGICLAGAAETESDGGIDRMEVFVHFGQSRQFKIGGTIILLDKVLSEEVHGAGPIQRLLIIGEGEMKAGHRFKKGGMGTATGGHDQSHEGSEPSLGRGFCNDGSFWRSNFDADFVVGENVITAVDDGYQI